MYILCNYKVKHNKWSQGKTIKNKIQAKNIKKQRIFIETIFLMLYLKVTNVTICLLLLVVNVIFVLLSMRNHNLINHCNHYFSFLNEFLIWTTIFLWANKFNNV